MDATSLLLARLARHRRWYPGLAAGCASALLLLWNLRHSHKDDVVSLLSEALAESESVAKSRSARCATHYAPPNPQQPALVLGLPKSGTSSIRSFFSCGGHNVSHWTCGRQPGLLFGSRAVFCADCVRENLRRRQPALDGCGGFDVYSQLDHIHPPDACFFPQVSALEALSQDYSSATLILNVRPVNRWLRSIKSWYRHGSMAERMASCDLPGLMSGSDGDLKAWYVQHIRRVRRFAAARPCHRLVEVHIENKSAASIMHNAFPSISASCWGHFNSNVKSGNR